MFGMDDSLVSSNQVLRMASSGDLNWIQSPSQSPHHQRLASALEDQSSLLHHRSPSKDSDLHLDLAEGRQVAEPMPLVLALLEVESPDAVLPQQVKVWLADANT